MSSQSLIVTLLQKQKDLMVDWTCPVSAKSKQVIKTEIVRAPGRNHGCVAGSSVVVVVGKNGLLCLATLA